MNRLIFSILAISIIGFSNVDVRGGTYWYHGFDLRETAAQSRPTQDRNAPQDPARPKNQETLNERRAGFEKKYKIEIVWKDPKLPIPLAGKHITGKAATEQEVQRYLPLIIEELSIYPKSFIGEVKLATIVICKDLSWGGQKRSAVPDFRRKTLYYDCEAGKFSKFYQRIVIHHEFYHVVDYSDDGLVYRDNRWNRLNRSDFKYGDGGASVQGDKSQSFYRKQTAGFITKYSMSGLEEDKAETFAHSMVNPVKIEKVTKDDKVLDRKVTRIRRLVRNMSRDMNDDFWKSVKQRQIQTEKKTKRKTVPKKDPRRSRVILRKTGLCVLNLVRAQSASE